MTSASILRESGLEVDLLLPDGVTRLRQQLADACVGGPTTLIACGGDGTVHQVLQAAAGSGSVLGIIPSGTGNDVARSLGIPVKDPAGWARTLATLVLEGRTREVDAALIARGDHREWTLGVISTGFDSAVNERADRMTRLSGTVRYLTALLAELREFHTYDYTVTMDGERRVGAALLIAVGNGDSYGGGMRICPAADMADGILDITWVDVAPRRTVLRVLPRIFSGRHVEHPLVHTYRAREITIDAHGPVVYADGDRVGTLPVAITAVPAALRMLVP